MRWNLSTLAALLLLGLAPTLAPALEITNLRPAYGPQGATRKLAKTPRILPGDILYIEFTIDGLKVDEKTNKVSYETVFEFLDGSSKVLLERKTPNQAVLQLGGNRMPGDMVVSVGDTFKPGKYTIKLTVKDKLAAKEVSIVYPLEVIAPEFGFVHVEAPALGLPGTQSGVQMLVTGFAVDKDKQPKVDVTIRLLDSAEKPVSLPNITSFPEAIPAGATQPVAALPVVFPISVLNRPGQFYVDIVAVDKNAKNREIRLRLPLTVLDVGAVTGR